MTEVPSVRLPSDHWRAWIEPWLILIEQHLDEHLSPRAIALLAEMAQAAAESQWSRELLETMRRLEDDGK